MFVGAMTSDTPDQPHGLMTQHYHTPIESEHPWSHLDMALLVLTLLFA